MLLVNNIKMHLGSNLDNATAAIAKQLRIPTEQILSAKLYRRSIDCRKKNNIHYTCSYLIEVKKEEHYLKKLSSARRFEPPQFEFEKVKSNVRPVVIGFGPAGMFAAYILALKGLRPIVFERGMAVEERAAAVEKFMQGGEWSPKGNIQFGEGGAGTFSDGKLNTGISNPYCRFVLETFADCGADKDILVDAKPHIGTDVLRTVVKNLRQKILALGGEIHFESRLSTISFDNNKLTAITVETGSSETEFPCSHLVLAIGHSARDTFRMLHNLSVPMQAKAFAIGARIEHKQSWLNKARYGDTEGLPPADYHLSAHLPDGRGVFTFCMCPGGEVVDARSDDGYIVTNGMSNKLREGENANSALLTGVSPDDFGGGVLDGMLLQEKIEQAAYIYGKGHPVCQKVGDFLAGKASCEAGEVKPSVKPTCTYGDIAELFPEYITEALRQGVGELAKKLPGFDAPEAMLTAPETRSSSPVRILRNETRQSDIVGLFPCGEGAGYAGGIMSAAVDGIETALALSEQI